MSSEPVTKSSAENVPKRRKKSEALAERALKRLEERRKVHYPKK